MFIAGPQEEVRAPLGAQFRTVSPDIWLLQSQTMNRPGSINIPLLQSAAFTILLVTATALDHRRLATHLR